MRLSGLEECGLCCEIMRDDGTMMRTPELKELAAKHDIKFITIKDLQEYRKNTINWSNVLPSPSCRQNSGSFVAHGYVNKLNGEHHIALVKGDITDGEDLLCRETPSAAGVSN